MNCVASWAEFTVFEREYSTAGTSGRSIQKICSYFAQAMSCFGTSCISDAGSKYIASENFECRYNELMHFAIFVIRLLELMFFVGLAGSAIVVFISFIEDGKELFGDE
jgi:hypothetical protein